MGCDTGQGSFLSMTVTKAYNCETEGTAFNDTQEMVLPIPQQIINITNQLRLRSFGEWTVSQEVFDAPRVDDPCGAFRRKRFGCDRDHTAWDAEFEWPEALIPETSTQRSKYDISLLVGAEGKIRRTQPDGSYWEGTGRIISATVLPSAASAEEMLGTLSIQWKGGGVNDPKYYPPPS